ncbi:pentapeptide repeat-containing protein [Domibacillus sp. PGB-M46]|uniref:pentapeptide repeat-containing protein n=1 Tax=Domibacillus sp. PGB-M46 TaxID=2910255 RepID=UPI001F596649|nr:pentapeptide repeat-containing protein [Domibacillus sp. PGB-M46]MCI2256966.1 pentapeptide repeat-containing protein [Domibacillus sp. PGB-M46]
MSSQLASKKSHLRADCEHCFGLCCVALPYAKSADFAMNKEGGTPCQNLTEDFNCGIHQNLRKKGFRGCAVYECFGAGQKVSKVTYKGASWREHPASAKEMFDVFPIMQQLHEMLCYVEEALEWKETAPIHQELQEAARDVEALTQLSPQAILKLDVPVHRARVNELLLRSSAYVRSQARSKKKSKAADRKDFFGAKLKGADLKGADLRGAIFIAADLRGADMRLTDLIGADFRDADLRGADLTGSIFLTQAQMNAAKGDRYTKLPASVRKPNHWL